MLIITANSETEMIFTAHRHTMPPGRTEPQFKDDRSILGFGQLSQGVIQHFVGLRHSAFFIRHDVKLQEPRQLRLINFSVLILC